MRQKIIIVASILLIAGGVLFLWQGRTKAAKTVSVSKEQELRTQLAANETATIRLKGNITVASKLEVKGNKTIDGKGYTIRRKTEKGKQYYGCVLNVAGSLTLSDVTVNGCCQNANMTAGATDRLVRVTGKLILDNGAILQQNYNANKQANCGGAVYIVEGGYVQMRSGSVIQDNRSKTGGGAVRIADDARFIMDGGTIRNNWVEASSGGNEYLGLGGAIHCRGEALIRGGTIEGNRALEKTVNGTPQGGLGGAIYTQGQVTIQGGNITRNYASGGGAIYITGTGSGRMSGGKLSYNTADHNGAGGAVFVNGGSQWEVQAGEIYANQAYTGGGIYASKSGTRVYLRGGWIYSNQINTSAGNGGPGVRNNGAYVCMEGGNLNAQPGGIVAENRNTSCSVPYRGSALSNTGQGEMMLKGGRIYSDQTENEPVYNDSTCLLGYQSPAGSGITGRGKNAIHNKGRLRISGNVQLTGEYGAMVYSTGEFSMLSGAIKGSRYGLENHGIAQISGGAVLGREYGIVQREGRLLISSAPNIEKIYLAKSMVIEEEGKVRLSGKVEITPEDYYDGRLVERAIYSGGAGENFWNQSKLAPKDVFYLYWEGTDVRIGKKGYQVQFHANGGKGQMSAVHFQQDQEERLPRCTFEREGYSFLGWSEEAEGTVRYEDQDTVTNAAENGETITLYAIWEKNPELKLKKQSLAVYEGEMIDKDILLSYVRAQDEQQGELTGAIVWESITYANGEKKRYPEHLDTSSNHLGEAIAAYSVTNDLGVKDTVHQKIRIERNESPQLITKERYFFQSELKDMSEEELLARLHKGVQFSDKEDKKDDIERYFDLDISKVNRKKAGSYQVSVSIRDQYGNRFYMEPEEKREYGDGKRTMKTFSVVIMEDSTGVENEGDGHVRFITTDYLGDLQPASKWKQLELYQELQRTLAKSGETEQCLQVWHFDSMDIRRAKQYMSQLADPFVRESNRGFWNQFRENCSWNTLKGGE